LLRLVHKDHRLKFYRVNNISQKTMLSMLITIFAFSSVLFSTDKLIGSVVIKYVVRISIIGFMLLIIVGNTKKIPVTLRMITGLLLLIFPIMSFSFTEQIVNSAILFFLCIIVNFVGFQNSSKYMLVGILFGILGVVIGMRIGIFRQRIFFAPISNRTRYFMGFENPNYFSLTLFQASLILQLVIRKFKFLLSFLLILPILILSVSRTPIIAYLSFMMFFLILKFMRKHFPNLGYWFSIISMLIIVTIGLLLPFVSKIPFPHYSDLDILLSYRLSLYSKSIDSTPLYSFLLGGRNAKVDSSYLTILLALGLPFMFFFVTLLIAKTKQFYKQNSIEKASMLLSIALYGITESIFFSPAIPIAILFWSLLLF